MTHRSGIALLLLIAACGESADPASPASPDGGSGANGGRGGSDASVAAPGADAGTAPVDLAAIDWTVNGICSPRRSKRPWSSSGTTWSRVSTAIATRA